VEYPRWYEFTQWFYPIQGYFKGYYQQPQFPSLGRGETTPTEEQSHQQKLYTNYWYGIAHDFLRG
jgi:hypothetical protein